ncbi:MAG: hypothetical protein WKG07_38810 [Hymenobacter sp.]
MSSTHLILRFTGDYSLAASVTLAASASFVDELYGGPDGEVLDLALLLEGSWRTVGVRLDQPAKQVRVQVLANPGGAPADDICAHLERFLCLDVEGAGFAAVAARDKVVDELRQRHLGLRPVLFPTPYEAAARAIIGHQLPLRQAAAITGRIAAAHGVRGRPGGPRAVRLSGSRPARGTTLVPGLAARKVEQLRALGQAAPDGLDTARLRAMDRDAALAHLQKLAGIGPFSAELILLRGVGDPDAFPRTEKRLHRAMAAAYSLGEEPALATLERVADQWRPYRSWAGLLLRNTISR